MAGLDDQRDIVAQSCRIVGKLGLTREPAGHVSARIPGTNRVLIKARGPGESALSYVTPRDIITVDFDGKKVEGPDDLQPPNEVFIHTWLYRTRPEVNSVIHIHPSTVVLFTICNKPLLPLYGAYEPSGLQLWLEGIPTYPHSWLISNDERGEELAEAIGPKSVCLMRGHGITTAASTVEEATLTAIRLNELAEMNYRASLLGTPEPIPQEDIESFRGMGARRREGAEAGAGRWPRGEGAYQNSTWRYYCQLLGV